MMKFTGSLGGIMLAAGLGIIAAPNAPTLAIALVIFGSAAIGMAIGSIADKE